MPDYPGAPGRTGYAVGLDVPASVIALLDDLAARRLRGARRAANVASICSTRSPPAAMRPHSASREYETLLARVPDAAVARLRDAWGEPADDPDVRDGRFRFRAQTFGNVIGRACRPTAAARRAPRRLS